MKKRNYTKQKVSRLLLLLMLFGSVKFVGAQTDFQLNGNGTQLDLGNNCFRLTTASGNKHGSVWSRKKADLSLDFDMTANLNFGTNDGNGADGIVFAFQNVCTSSGGGGGGMGINGVSPSIFVEFDTHNNSEFSDPSYDHVAILKNGVVDHSSSSSLVSPVGIIAGNGNVENGQDYLVRILWTAADSTLNVYVNNNLRTTYTGNVVNTIFGGSPYVYWGFTAATGGFNNLHKVCIVDVPSNVVSLQDFTICEGQSQQVNLPGGTSYNWTPNYNISSTTISNPTVFPDVTTSYIVSITDACNNLQTDTMLVTVNPLPTVNLSLPFTQKCEGEAAVSLSGGSPAGGTYSGVGVTGNSFNPTIAGVGIHNIVYTYTNSNGCSNSDIAIVTVISAPNVNFTALSAVCSNAPSFSLSGGSPAGGVYSGLGVSNGSFNPSIAGAGTHIISYTYTNVNGCVGVAASSITVNQTPLTTINTPSGIVICNGSSINLSTSAAIGVSFQWFLNGNSVTNSAPLNTSYNASAAGSYTLTAISANGCSATSSPLVITSGINPNPTITSATTTFCPNEQVLINSNLAANETAEWYLNNSVITNQTTSILTTTQAGTYYVQVTSSTGCTANSNSIILTELQGVTASITSAITTFCPGTNAININTTNTSGASYVWYNGANVISGAATSTYSATLPGTYSVEITASSGCSSTSSTIVLVTGTAPMAQLTTSDTTFCQSTSAILTATNLAGGVYQWFHNGNSFSGNTNVINANQDGAYYAIITNSVGCTNSTNTIQISELPAPTATITANNTSICPGANVIFTANAVNSATYEWFRNGVSLGAASSSATSYTATLAGNYTVTINNGCNAISNAISISTATLPGNVFTIYGYNTQCAGSVDLYSINSVSGANYYLWEVTPANGASIGSGQGTTDVDINFLNQNVTITVTPQNGCGNGGSQTESVQIDNSFCFGPQFGGYPTNTCTGSTVTFYNYSDPTQYFGLTPQWVFGVGAIPATATGNGPHTVTYSSSGAKTVTLNYVDMFGNVVENETRNAYINISGAVTTSAISGLTTLPSCIGVTQNYSVTSVSGSTFQWTIPAGASILSGQGSNSITVNFTSGGGTISVLQTNLSGCVATSVSIQVDCVTGFNDLEHLNLLTLNLYPNPANTQLTLDIVSTFNDAYTANIVNMQGQEVFHSQGHLQTGNYKQNIDISELANGVYILTIKTNHKAITKRLIVQH